MQTQIVESRNGADLVRVTPTLAGRKFYLIERAGRPVSRTYNTIRVARKALKLFAYNSGYPVIERNTWLKTGIDKFGHGGI